jgi:hypothetical protein
VEQFFLIEIRENFDQDLIREVEQLHGNTTQ